jgi:uncharacterized damage-inducible protein DinB
MSELDLVREWFRYNDDARASYRAVLEKVPMAELVKDRGASFPLLDIFLHVLDGRRVWIGWVATDRMKEFERVIPTIRYRGRIRTFPDLDAALLEDRALVSGFLGNLTEADLSRVLEYDDHDEGKPWFRARVRLRDLLWHLVEEEIQHRGEMNALLWQLDREPPILDWVDWKAPGVSR